MAGSLSVVYVCVAICAKLVEGGSKLFLNNMLNNLRTAFFTTMLST